FVRGFPRSSTFFPYTALFRSIHTHNALVHSSSKNGVGHGPEPLAETGLGGTDALAVFDRVRAQLRARLGKDVFASWFERVKLVEDRKSTRLNSSHVKMSYAV